jgi:xylulokinase
MAFARYPAAVNAPREAVLGIDVGTSQLKALVAGPEGAVLGRGRAGYQVTAPADGHAEIDPEEWWRAAREAVREALAEAGTDAGPGTGTGTGPRIVAVGITGQMHGVVLAEADATPLRPAIVWLDRRAADAAASYARLPADAVERLGNAPSPGMAGPLLAWLAANEPAAVAAAAWQLQPKDWLRLRLTGRAATDPTDASGTLLFDQVSGAWSGAVADGLGIPGRLLPPVLDPGAAAGRLLPAAAARLGLAGGLPVVTGAADTAASLLAAGLPGDAALLTLGTGGQWVARTTATRPAAGLNLFKAVEGGAYHLAAAQNAGQVFGWVRALHGVSYDHLYALAARAWCADSPVFLPYLAGERWDSPAGGTWSGLTLRHDRDDLLRAALEGVAFLLRDRLADLRAAGHDPRCVLLGGGGVQHPGWRRLLADVFGLPLRIAPGSSWLSVTGAAMLAERAAGWGVTRDRSGESEVIEPRHTQAAEAGYARFSALRRRIQQLPTN